MPRHLVKCVQEVPLPHPSPSFHEACSASCAKGQVSEVMHTSKDRNSDGAGGAFHPGTPVLGCSFKRFCKGLKMGSGRLTTQQTVFFENLCKTNESTSPSLWNVNRSLKHTQTCASSEALYCSASPMYLSTRYLEILTKRISSTSLKLEKNHFTYKM